MRLALVIAWRYLLAKKSTNVINIITWISVLGLSIGTAALILILSVFNGFETVLTGLFDTFNPQLKITPTTGKFFEIPDSTWNKLIQIPSVDHVGKSIEEVALFEYKGSQEVGIIKGVDSNYAQITDIENNLRAGQYIIEDDEVRYGIVGSGLGAKLSLNYNDPISPVKVYMPTRRSRGPLAKDYKTLDIYASGIFTAGSEADMQYIVTHYDYVNRLLDLNGQNTSLEVKLVEGADEEESRKEILAVLGEEYLIKNRYEQDETFFKVMNTEKWVAFLITSFVMLIIAFNLVGSLWMLVLEKKHDLSILQAIGMESRNIRSLILLQGGLISIIGLISGIVIALILYFLQKNFGLIGIPEGFLIDSYPIDLRIRDFLLVIITVLVIGGLASLLPAYRAGKITPYIRMEV